MLSETEILLTYPWLTKDLFREIIATHVENDTVEIIDFAVKGALGPGENYTSTMIRATVNYAINGERQEKRFIIKAGHYKMEVRNMLNEMNLFEKEMTMYRDIIPKVEELLAGIGDNGKLAAKCYKVKDDLQDPYIILEDLTVKGYKNRDRRLGLDIDHYKKALSKIAKWHAATAVLLETTNYEKYPAVQEYRCELASGMATKFTINAVLIAAELVKSMAGFEYLSEKLSNSWKTILSKTRGFLEENDSSFVTLCHGDLWMNNIMFNYDESDHPVDAILVDYQVPYRGPAILDVINTLLSSSCEEIQDREWDLLVQYYHKVRHETLEKLDYPMALPSLTQTQIEFLEKGVAYGGVALWAPGARKLENTGEDVTSFLGDDEASRKFNLRMMANPKARKTLEFILDYCNRKGYFD